MRFSRFRPVWAACLVLEAAARDAEHEPASTRNIAIIGAGAAGSSAAYHLRQFAQDGSVAVNITVFEKTDHIGGRSVTVNAFDDPLLPIELGASIFVKINHVLYNATQKFNLSTGGMLMNEPDDITAIWDGQDFVFQTTENTPSWWQTAKLLWRYGTSPYRATKLVDQVVGKFLHAYEAPYFPFKSLTALVYDLGLVNVTALTGEQFLAQNNIDPNFSREILQPATRVNYASNLAYVHGLETMVSFATDGAVSVTGGNWQIFQHMIQDSKAAVYRNTSVTSIAYAEKRQQHQQPDSPPKYLLSTKSSSSSSSRGEEYPIEFDDVIIASPWQYSSIEAAGVIKSKVEEIPYTKLHVTLFASPCKLRAGYFHLDLGSKAPSNVYTTLSKDEVPKTGPEGVGRTGFYSISTLRTAVNPKTNKTEYVYKIFSPAEVSPAFLSAILDVEAQETPYPPPSSSSADADPEDGPNSTTAPAGSAPISWYYPHWFHSYPIELPRVTFQEPILGRGLYYTSGIESFISTMETSALMGMNVARLIIDDVTGAQSLVNGDQKRVSDAKESDGSGEL